MALASYRRCAVFLVAALALDALGLVLVLVGAVAQPALDGEPYGDFLVLTGALLLFLSLLCWLLWYSGNLRGVPADELPLKARPDGGSGGGEAPRRRTPAARDSLLRLAAKLSERLSQRRRQGPAPSALFSPPKTWPAAANAPARPGGAPKLELGSLPPRVASAAEQLQQGAVVERLV